MYSRWMLPEIVESDARFTGIPSELGRMRKSLFELESSDEYTGFVR